jgi:hypothetical protein
MLKLYLKHDKKYLKSNEVLTAYEKYKNTVKTVFRLCRPDRTRWDTDT